MLSRRRFLQGTSLLALAGCSRQSSDEPFWIGHVGPLSGTEQAVGEHTQRGIRLALADVNTEGERRLAVVHADSRGQAERARSEAVRLVSVNRVLVLVGGSDQADADRLALALQPYPTPLLTPAPHTSAGMKNTFSLDVTAEFRGTSLARFAADHLKAGQAALLVDETSAICAGVGSAFTQQWLSSSERKVHSWNPREETSRSRLVERLKKVKAQVVLFAGAASDFLAARDVLVAGKVTLPLIFGGEPSEWQKLQRNSDVDGDVFGGTVHATSRFDEMGKTFKKQYQEKYHEEPDASACQGYELIRVLATLLRKVKGASLKLREELPDMEDLPGLTGGFHFRQAHAVRRLYIVRVRDPIPVETFKPEE